MLQQLRVKTNVLAQNRPLGGEFIEQFGRSLNQMADCC